MAEPRPFRVLGVQQIALGGRDKPALRRLWVELLGLELVGTFRSERENVDEDIARRRRGRVRRRNRPDAADRSGKKPAGARAGAQPRRACGWTTCRRPCEWLTEQGVRFTPGGIRKGAAGHDVCFVHPKGSAEAPLGGRGRADRARAGA